METQRALRGHDFLPPARERALIPGAYKTEKTPTAEKTIHLHYFCPAGDWYVAELWREDGRWLAFGYTKLASYPDGEWGYISLDELEQFNVRPRRGLPVPIYVERDCYWTPVPFWRVRHPFNDYGYDLLAKQSHLDGCKPEVIAKRCRDAHAAGAPKDAISIGHGEHESRWYTAAQAAEDGATELLEKLGVHTGLSRVP